MRRALLAAVLAMTSCVYFNAMYDAEQYYDDAVLASRDGRPGNARILYDSAIAMTAEIVANHPDSKHAAPAALLKSRAEIARDLWDSAAESARRVHGLTDDPRHLSTARGLEGIALKGNGRSLAAEELLTAALEGDLSRDDRALFHFHRGLARLDVGKAAQAVEDLESVGAEGGLDENVRLDLARGLSDVGQHEQSARITDELIREGRLATFAEGMDAHLDSLVRRDPATVDSMFAEQLRTTDAPPTKRALLQYYRGLAREWMGDPAGAVVFYDSARIHAGQGRYSAEATYRWARLSILEAEEPADIVATLRPLDSAGAIPEPAVAAAVVRLQQQVAEFANLVDAYETRGGTAAEAALRAAEIAGAQLGARRVARGLYLRYLALAPDSPWQAKAIAGAMLHADWPAGDWAADEGEVTDRRLEDRLAALPPSDPYRVSIQDLPRDEALDSAYVESERLLRRRIVEIRMLYDTTAAIIERPDTLPADDADDPGADDGEPRVEE